MKIYKIRPYCHGQWLCLDSLESLIDVLDYEGDEVEELINKLKDSPVGSKLECGEYMIEIVEMSKFEFDNLLEFMGW